MSHEVLIKGMREYAQAIRGDWGDFDGRTERDVINGWTEEIETPTDQTIEQFRASHGLCPDGNGHWEGFSWGHCSKEECPTSYADHKQRGDEWEAAHPGKRWPGW